MTIRPFRGDDEPALLALWSAAMPYDALDAGGLRDRVLLDPNVGEESLLVAEEGAELLGFVLAIQRREPFGELGLQAESAWITAFGVAPGRRRQGLGTALFEQTEERLAAAGVRSLSLSPYLPGYFVPGVDEVRYAAAVEFLAARGYVVTSRPISMDANLVTFDFTPYHARAERLADEGVRVAALGASTLPAFLRFAEAELPYDWLRSARALLGRAPLERVQVALADGRVVGYCQHEGEHFGPFGVSEAWRGRGVGTVLLARCLEAMRQSGLHHAWVLWTSDENAERVYGRFGFRETRRFRVMRKAFT